MVLSNLFIVSTPRHWLLAVYLNQVQLKDKKSVVVLDDHLVHDSIYQDLAEDFFDHVYVLKNTQDWLKIRFIKKLFQRYNFEQVFSGPVSDSYAQYAASRVNVFSKKGFYLLDDGLFSYQRIDSKKVKLSDFWLRRWLWGAWYRRSEDYRLECPWVSGAYLFHQGLLQCSTTKEVKFVDSNWLWELESLGVIERLMAFYKVSIKQVSDASVLLVLGVFKSLQQENLAYFDELFFFVNEQEARGNTIVIKPHPRNNKNVALPSKAVLPKGLPFEVLMSRLSQEALIVGDISTTLLDFKLFRPANRVVAVSNYLNDASHCLLTRAGIEIVETFKEVKF